jgi:aspartate racemase
MPPDVPTIGILGGMSATSTVEYYRELNARVNARLGGHHAAEVLIHSVDFGEFEPLIQADEWDEIADRLAAAAARLDAGGADFLLVATNTMHRVAPAIESAVSIPLVHIADVTADAANAAGLDTLGVLGTKPVMDASFYRNRLADHGIEVVVPDAESRELVDSVIFEELTHGVFTDASRDDYREVMDDLADAGAEGIVLGCTEIGELVSDSDYDRVPLLDTTDLHVQRAVELQLGDRPVPEV